MPVLTKTILLLFLSNMFMLSAWYMHLKLPASRPIVYAVLMSWGIAFFEYCFHIPANRIGATVLTLPQLQILQVAISLMVFVPFAVIVMGQSVKLDYVWASLCIVGATYFVFRNMA